MVEGARLESVYTPKGYREFESRRLRQISISKFSIFFDRYRQIYLSDYMEKKINVRSAFYAYLKHPPLRDVPSKSRRLR